MHRVKEEEDRCTGWSPRWEAGLWGEANVSLNFESTSNELDDLVQVNLQKRYL